MAAKVGTSTTGNADANTASIASSAKSTTTGNLISVEIKWEWDGIGTAPQLSSVTDTAGNSYTLEQKTVPTTSTTAGAIAWAKNITGHASNVVTANFANATASYRRIIQTEFSGLDTTSPVDGTSQVNSGPGGGAGVVWHATTANITTTTSGVMVYGCSGFSNLSAIAGEGTPTSTIDVTVPNELFSGYYISSGAQTITPGARATPGGTGSHWVMCAVAFKDAVTGQTALPDADIADGAWVPSTGTDLYATLDDVTDTEYITTPSHSECEIGMQTLSTPAAGTKTFSYRHSGSPAKKLTASVYDGASLIQPFTHDPCSPTLATADQTITNAISSYADLRIRFTSAAATTPPTTQVTYGAIGTSASGSTTAAPAYPTGISATTSKLYCIISSRSTTEANAATMPAGWTSIANQLGGASATYAADVGTRRIQVFEKDTTLGTETGTVTVSLTGGDTMRATIMRVEIPAGYTITESVGLANDSSAGTGFSAATAGTVSFAPNDLVLIAVAQSIDTGTQSAQSITAAGITFGTRTNRATDAVTTGFDHRHIIDTVPVSSGTATVTATYAYTISATGSGPCAIISLRAVPPTEFARVTWAKITVPLAGGSSTDLVIQDATHAHTADALTLTTASVLVVQDATHAHLAEDLVLASSRLLAIQDATHAHLADSFALASTRLLAIQDATHAHLADNVVLSAVLSTSLVIADATHAHTVDSFALASTRLLAIQDATHAHTADALTLGITTVTTLAIQDATHAHLADNVVLTSQIALVIDDATHAHLVDDVGAFTFSTTLAIEDATHAHTADGDFAIDNQIILPDADISDGGWIPSTGTDLYATLDDETDTEYIYTLSNTIGDIGMQTASTPIAGTKTFSYRLKGSPAQKIVASVYNGGALIQSFAHEPCPIALTTFNQTITNAIPSYADLRIRFQTANVAFPTTPQVQFGTFGTGASGSTSCTPAYPTGITVNSRLYCIVSSRSTVESNSATMVGWTEIANKLGGASVTYAADVGTRRIQVFKKDTVLGTETSSDTETVSLVSGDTMRATIMRVVPIPSGSDTAESVGLADDNTNGTSFSATAGAVSFAPNDLVLIAVAQNIDTGTQGAQAITASGITFGTLTVRRNEAVNVGFQHRHIWDTVPVSAGSASGTVAPTYSYTSNLAGSGPCVVISIRSVAPPEFARVTWAKITLPAATTAATSLVIQDATHAHTVDNIVLGVELSLVIADATHAHTADNIALSSTRLLAIQDATHAHLADGAGFTLQTQLAIQDATHAHTADALTLGTTTVTTLVVADATHAHTADSLALASTRLLAIQDALHAHTVDNLVLNSALNLAIQDATHAHTVDNLVLASTRLLAIQETLHAHTADALTLASTRLLAIQDALHAHTADNLALTLQTTLVIQDATHSHFVDSVVLSVVGQTTLIVADALHAHTADSLALASTRLLAIQDALHAHTVDNIVLGTTTHTTLAIQDATHAHTVDNLLLGIGLSLVIADATHAHLADNIVLASTRLLVIHDATHAHFADGAGFTLQTQLVIQDATHAHTVDALTLSTSIRLFIADAMHAHAADTLALASTRLLAIQDALHAHTADNITLNILLAIGTQDTLHAHTADNIVLTSSTRITIQDATHAHTVDLANASTSTFLVIADALHAHTADNVVLGFPTSLVIADALHAHTADNLLISVLLTLAIQDALHAHTADTLSSFGLNTYLAIQDATHTHLVDGAGFTLQTQLSIQDALHIHTADVCALNTGLPIAHLVDEVIWVTPFVEAVLVETVVSVQWATPFVEAVFIETVVEAIFVDEDVTAIFEEEEIWLA